MDVGKGYAAEGPAGETGFHEISFDGPPNFGTNRNRVLFSIMMRGTTKTQIMILIL